MNILAQLLSNQVRVEIFRLLFDRNKTAIHLRDLQRKSLLSIGTIQKEISHLKELDLVLIPVEKKMKPNTISLET